MELPDADQIEPAPFVDQIIGWLDLPEDIQGEIASRWDLLTVFRFTRMVCKSFKADHFAWTHLKAIKLDIISASTIKLVMLNNLLPLVHLLERIESFSGQPPRWFEHDLYSPYSDLLIKLAPKIKTPSAILRVLNAEQELVYANLNTAIIEDLYVDCFRLGAVLKPACYPRLTSLRLRATYNTDPNKLVEWLDMFAPKTGKLEYFELSFGFHFNIRGDISATDLDMILAAFRKVTTANRRSLQTVSLDNIILTHSSSTPIKGLAPEDWPSIPRRIESLFGVLATACTIFKNDTFDFFAEHVLFEYLRAHPDFEPDLGMLQTLYNELHHAGDDRPHLDHLARYLCHPKLKPVQCLDTLLTWAEEQVIQRVDLERRWAFRLEDRVLADMLTVLGARLVLKDQPAEKVERARQICTEILQQHPAPLRILQHSLIDDIPDEIPDVLLHVCLEYSDWCPPDTKIADLNFFDPWLWGHRKTTCFEALVSHPKLLIGSRMPSGESVVQYLWGVWSEQASTGDAPTCAALDRLMELMVIHNVSVACWGLLGAYCLCGLDGEPVDSPLIAKRGRHYGQFIQSPEPLLPDILGCSPHEWHDLLIFSKFVFLGYEERHPEAAETIAAMKTNEVERIWKCLLEGIEAIDENTLEQLSRLLVQLLGASRFLVEFATNPTDDSLLGIKLGDHISSKLHDLLKELLPKQP